MTRTLPLLACLMLPVPAAAQPRTDAHGDPLPDGAVARFGSVRFRIGSTHHPVQAWVLSADGKTLAVPNGEGFAFWDIDTGRVVRRLAASPAGWPCFSPDGKHLVHLEGLRVSLLDPATGRERHVWDLPQAGATVSFLPGTSRFVVTRQGSKRAHLFDAGEVAFVRACEADEPVEVMAPSGRLFLGQSDAGFHLVDAQTGRVRSRIPAPADFEPEPAGLYPRFQRWALSPDDRRLYWVGRSGALHTFDAETGRELDTYDPPDGRGVAQVVLSPDGRVAYVTTPGNPTRRRDVQSGEWLAPLPAMPPGSLVPHPDGKRLLLIGTDGVLRRYDLATRHEVPPPPGFDTELLVAASPDGRRVAIASGELAARLDLFDPTGRRLWSVPLRGRPAGPRWSADGRQVACATDQEVTVCDPASGRVLHTLPAPGGDRWFGGPVGFDAAGDRLVAALDHGEALAVFPLGGGTKAQVFEPGDRWATDVSPDGRTVVFENGAPTVALFDVPAGRFRVGFGPPPPGSICGHGFSPGPNATRFSPDGTYLFAAAADGVVVLSDPATGGPAGRIETGFERIEQCAASADGLWLAVATGHRVSVWEVASGKHLVTRQLRHGEEITGLAFAGPGRLITTSTDLTALLWDVSPRKRPKGSLWDALAGDDARAANRAAWALAADPRGPDLLRSRIAPATPPPAAQLRRVIAQLASDDYRARETAMRDLRALGRVVEPDLRAARERATSEEVRTRLERLLTEVPRLRTADEWVQARAVLALEVAGTEAARKVLAEWAAGAPGARLTRDARAALGRLSAAR